MTIDVASDEEGPCIWWEGDTMYVLGNDGAVHAFTRPRCTGLEFHGSAIESVKVTGTFVAPAPLRGDGHKGE